MKDYNDKIFNFLETGKITIKELEFPKWNYKWTCPKCGCHTVTYMATSFGKEWGYHVVCVYCQNVIKTIDEDVPNGG